MADFDFAPRPPKQSDDQGEPSPFALKSGPADLSPFGLTDPAKDKKAAEAGPGTGPANGTGNANNSNGKGRPSPFSRAETRNQARRNPAESSGMLGGLMSMVTTMAMAGHTEGHVSPISSPTGIMGMIKSAFSGKHEQSDDHSFNLDLSRHGTAGGGLGGMSTGLGMVGGPVQAKSKSDSTGAAMKAIGSMARGTGGGLGAVLGSGGAAARKHMHWLSQGVKNVYKVDR